MPKNNKFINYHQNEIYKQLLAYVTHTNGALPYDSANGLCSGLVAYALYCERHDLEADFTNELDYVLNWNPKEFSELGLLQDPIMERFINNVTFLHFDHVLRHDENVAQRDLEKSLELLDGHEHFKANEITFVFNRGNLASLINTQALPDRMIRIENGFHAIGLIYRDGVYKLYNFENTAGLQTVLTATKAAEVIFAGLAEHCHSKKHIALNFRVFDPIDAEVEFPTLEEYTRPFLNDQQYKKAVLSHPNIFHLASRMEDYALMDLLFAHGYEYIPWQMDRFPEINEAVIQNNKQMLNYLLEHGISLDYRTARGMTPLGEAIAYNKLEMLFELLEAGANPNAEVRKDVSSLDLALAKRSPEAVVMLLAFELNVTENELGKLRIYFSAQEIDVIKNLAVAFNAKVLGVKNNLDISTADNKQIITLLHHLRMRSRIAKGPDKRELAVTLKQVAAKFYTPEPNNLSAFSEKVEMYNLLQSFKMNGLHVRATYYLGKTLDNVVKQTLNMPYGYYSPEARQSIATTLKTIDDILEFKTEMKVNFFLRHKMYQAKRKLERHISLYHTLQSFQQERQKHLLFGSNNCQLDRHIGFVQDIKPELNFGRAQHA